MGNGGFGNILLETIMMVYIYLMTSEDGIRIYERCPLPPDSSQNFEYNPHLIQTLMEPIGRSIILYVKTIMCHVLTSFVGYIYASSIVGDTRLHRATATENSFHGQSRGT